MRKRDDSGQVKFWQIAIVLVLFFVVAFDLLSPQLAKVQMKDKGDNVALQESQSFQRGGSSSYGERYYQVCQGVTKDIEGYGAKLVAQSSDQVIVDGKVCPSVSEDGRVKFRMQKSAPTILLGRLFMKNYYVVTVDIDEKYSI